MRPSSKKRLVTVKAPHCKALRQLLHGQNRASPTVLNHFRIQGWTTGEAGGHQLTALGRQLAELAERVGPDADMKLTLVDGQPQ